MGSTASRVLMPKTTVHKDDFLTRTEHQIRPTRQIIYVQSVTITEAMNRPPHSHLRFHTGAADPTHVDATNFWADPIHNYAVSLYPLLGLLGVFPQSFFRIRLSSLARQLSVLPPPSPMW